MHYNISPETLFDVLSEDILPRKFVKDRYIPDFEGVGMIDGTFDVPHENTYSVAPNGARFTKTKRGFLPIVVENVFLQRKAAKTKEFECDKLATKASQILAKRIDVIHGSFNKQSIEQYLEMSDSSLSEMTNDELEYVVKFAREQEKMNNVIQLVRKILINSLYGALGNAGFRFYDVRLAEAITTGGQLSIRWIERKLNEFMNKLCETKDDDYITYIDTDSVYMSVQKFVEKMCKKKGIVESDKTTAEWVDLLDNFAKNICEPYIAKSYQEMADYMNAYEQRMFMDREVIADCGFWTSKKRYALRVWDNEGKRKYNSAGELDYKLKIMGLETQKSSTPPFASTSLKKSIDVILMGDESKLHEYVQHVLSEYPKQDYSVIASVISVNNIEKYSDAMGNPLKGSSAQVKASLAFNNLAKQHAAVDPIKSGEKVQMLILKQPNPTHADKIAYPSGEVLPDDFGIDFSKWIDYRAMSQDHFLSPLQSMCDAIGWETEKRIKLNAVLDI